jgi:hypothetical protein
MYWNILLKGQELPLPARMSMAGKAAAGQAAVGQPPAGQKA